MSANRNEPLLPLEIILNVIDYVVAFQYSTSQPQPIALAPGHPTTKTLFSLLLTSRATYPVARRFLYTHCMYIRTSQRLSLLVRTLTAPPSLHTLPPATDLVPCITSLYLRPFQMHGEWNSPLELPIARDTKALLQLIGPYLRRLLIDMPLRSLYPEDDKFNIRPVLRSAFIDFPVLEEFCSVCDELYLDTDPRSPGPSKELQVWSLWPNLKRLALYNQDVSHLEFWIGLQKLENIQTVVLTRSDGAEEGDLHEWWRMDSKNERHLRPLTLALANVEGDQPRLVTNTWKDDDSLIVKKFNVPISYYGDEHRIVLCQKWIKRLFMSGQLWAEVSTIEEEKKTIP